MKSERKLPFIFIIILVIAALFGRLGSAPLAHEEPRRAVIALESLYGDNVFQSTLHGENYYRKPPLYNLVIACFYKISGHTNEYISRLPSVLSFILLAIFLFYFVKRYFDKKTAILATIIFIASEDLLLYYSRMAEMDLFYSFLSFPLIVLPWAFLRENKKWPFYVVPPILAGFGFISKGLPSLAFLGISMLIAIILNKKYKYIISPWVFISILMFSLPLLVYFLPQYFQGNLDESLQVLLAESIDRTTATDTSFLNRISHLFLFPLDVLKGMLPFSFLIFFIRKKHFQNYFIAAMCILFLANFSIYLLSPGARLRYVYMLFPLLSILFAHIAIDIKTEIEIKLSQISNWLLLFLIILGIAAMIYFRAPDFLLILGVIITTIFFVRKKTLQLPYYWLVLIAMLFVRISIDFVAAQPSIIAKDKAYLEKNDAISLFASYGNRNVYLNTRTEQFYTFSYNYSALKKAALKYGFGFEDKLGVYIIRPEDKQQNLVKISDFSIGNDFNFILVEYARNK